MDAELRRRYQNLGKQIYEEWSDKIDRREKEKELKGELKAKEEASISDQLKRENELRKIMKEGERMQRSRICCKRQMPLDTYIRKIKRKSNSS